MNPNMFSLPMYQYYIPASCSLGAVEPQPMVYGYHLSNIQHRQLRWVGMLYRPSNPPVGQPLHGGVGLQNLPKMPGTFRFGIHTDFAPKIVPHTNVTNRCFLQLPFTVPNCSHCSPQLLFLDLQETTIEWSGATPVPLRLDESTGFRFRHVGGPRCGATRRCGQRLL